MPREGFIPARPRRSGEIELLPACPEVLAAAEERGVRNVMHFTTMTGAVGVLAAGAVKSRERLPEDKYLEYVYQTERKVPQGHCMAGLCESLRGAHQRLDV